MTNDVKLKKLERLSKADDPLEVFDRLENLDEKVSELESKDSELTDGLKRLDSDISDARRELNQKIDEVEKIEGPAGKDGLDGRDGKDGKDGVDGHTPRKGKDYFTPPERDEMIREVVGLVPVPENGRDGADGRDGVEISPEEVRDKLESLQDDQRLSISAIHELEEILDELRKRPVGRGGGGFSKIAMDSHIIDDETPSGIINGSNTAFVLAGDPNPLSSLKVYRNGMRQRVSEDYTISGRTITFTTAPVVGEIILCDYRN